MRKAAFLSMDSLENFECYDHLLIEPLAKINWQIDTISWRIEKVNWEKYNAVVVRSTWDYQDDVDKFIGRLEEIDSQTRLENNIDILKWNMDKIYLKELEEKGIKIVPTLWRNKFDEKELPDYFNQFETDQIIIKPTISANADNTFLINKSSLNSQLAILNSQYANRPFMVQPFMRSIVSEGEYSLFYFGGKYSHAILKTPKEKDFRVQEEHGGILKLVEPDELMKKKSEAILNSIDYKLLYARIDFVRTEADDFALMELELIEPSLYFNMDPNSAERFAKIFNEWMGKKSQALF